MFEHQHWNEILNVICYDCGDFYRVFGGTIVQVIPNPLHRMLISDKDNPPTYDSYVENLRRYHLPNAKSCAGGDLADRLTECRAA